MCKKLCNQHTQREMQGVGPTSMIVCDQSECKNREREREKDKEENAFCIKFHNFHEKINPLWLEKKRREYGQNLFANGVEKNCRIFFCRVGCVCGNN